LRISVAAEALLGGPDSDDGMTEVSGMTGLTTNLGEDQDLSGAWPLARGDSARLFGGAAPDGIAPHRPARAHSCRL
jgi:hypothetical protein